MPNDAVRRWLRELAELSVLDDRDPQSFRARAYERAMHALEAVEVDLSTLPKARLMKIPGVGNATASKILEFYDTGKVGKLEALREKHPASVVELSRVPGLGPKKLWQLRSERDVHSVDALRVALENGDLADMKGWGSKTLENLERSLDRLGWKHGERRTPIADAMRQARAFCDELERLAGVHQVRPCGSLRRMCETVGDLDIVVAAEDAEPVMRFVREHPDVKEVLASGETKTSVVTHRDLQVDVRVVSEQAFGAAVLYFTGSKAHNIRLRSRAQERGWTLNEYALTEVEGGQVIASEDEESIYEALALPWIPPPMREDTGEIEAADQGTLPAWLRESDLRGDLHVHTTYSGDGRTPLREMVRAAHERGYGYLAITDHGEDLTINGVSRDDLARQADELAELRETYTDLLLMRGCELNIAADGGLDYDPEFRAELDWCIAAVHSHYDLPQARQTERLITAMADPSVRVIAHLTGRMIGRRPGIDIDVDAVLEALVEYGVALELNSALPRLDAAAPVLRRAMAKGVTVVVSSDAHHISELARTRHGAAHGQRGWLERERVLNTWDRGRFEAWWRGPGA